MWRNYILLATLIGMFSKGIATDAPLVVIGFRTPEEAYIAKAMLELHTDTAVLKQYAHRAGYAVVERGQVIYLFPPSVTRLNGYRIAHDVVSELLGLLEPDSAVSYNELPEPIRQLLEGWVQQAIDSSPYTPPHRDELRIGLFYKVEMRVRLKDRDYPVPSMLVPIEQGQKGGKPSRGVEPLQPLPPNLSNSSSWSLLFSETLSLEQQAAHAQAYYRWVSKLTEEAKSALKQLESRALEQILEKWAIAKKHLQSSLSVPFESLPASVQEHIVDTLTRLEGVSLQTSDLSQVTVQFDSELSGYTLSVQIPTGERRKVGAFERSVRAGVGWSLRVMASEWEQRLRQ
jgi:hypothetical protein